MPGARAPSQQGISMPRWVGLVLVLALAGCGHAPPRTLEPRLGDLDREAETAFAAGRYRDAGTIWQRAADLAGSEGQPAWGARLLLQRARVGEATGRYEEARGLAAGALAAARALPDRRLEGQALALLGLLARRLGEPAAALEYLARAQVLAGELQAPALEAEAVRYAGAVHQDRGEDAEAARLYQRSLALSRAAGDLDGQARALNSLGGLHRLRAEYAPAMARYEESLALRRRLGDPGGEATVLGNQCLVYQNLGDLGQALDHCERSLALAREAGDRGAEANALNNIGAIRRARGDYRGALDVYQRSLAIKRSLPDPAGEARTLNNLGDLHRLLGEPERAVDRLSRSLAIKQRLGDRPGEAASHQNLGTLQLALGRPEPAREHFAQALALAGADGRPEQLWRAFDGLSQVHAATGSPRAAVLFGKQAVNLIQSVRAGIETLEPALQGAFLRDKAAVYRRLAELLIDHGRFLEAQQVLAMLKEEEYFDFVRRSAEVDPRATRASLTTAEAPWRGRYEAIQARVAAIGQEYGALIRKEPLDPSEEARLRALGEDLKAARQAYYAYLEELRGAFAGEAPVEFGKRDLDSLLAFRGTLKELGHGAVLVHYFVTADRVRMIVTGPEESTPPLHRESAVPRAELNALIWRYREKLIDPCADPAPEARELYRHLIAPVQGDLQAYGARTLMVYLDQALRYLPLAALQDGEGPLAERYAVAMYTVAAKASLQAPPVRDWRVAGLGASAGGDGFPALPAVREELDGIVKEGESDPHGVWPGSTYMDAAFTADRLRRVLYSGFRVVHLASHFRFVPGTEADSYLLTGDGERLTLAELKTGDFPFTGVDLLALSACETGVGDQRADGREVESFGALAQNQGARAVLATLWEVPDRSTARFMEQFYTRRRAGQTKAEALREVQRAFLRQAVAPAGDETRGAVIARAGQCPGVMPGYAHPYYWAPFVLMGNWL
jgi:CHAT domain-containing protein/Tfp pilus assembly protein PilF